MQLLYLPFIVSSFATVVWPLTRCPLWARSGHSHCNRPCPLTAESGHVQRKHRCPL